MTESYRARLLMSEFVTHDVKRFVVEKPKGFSFTPGQGVDLAINRPDWQNETRPFTPTNYIDDEVLEFTIKNYPDHEGVTRELHNLPAGSELLISEPFGTISYQGPGVFIAGGAGITPFIAILRDRARADDLTHSSLLFSNKTARDIIYARELRHYLGPRCMFTCTAEQSAECTHQRINESFLAENITNFNQPFYVCGPPGFMKAITGALENLGADPQSLVFER